MRTRILDQPIDIVDMEEAIRLGKLAMLDAKQLKIITLNPEMIVNASKNIEFQAAINSANLIVPDGTGIVFALKLLKNGACKNLKRIPGIELAEKLLECANEFSKRVAVYGGNKEVLEYAIKNIKEKYQNLEIVKAIDGYRLKENETDIANEIALTKPSLLLVGLGSPNQEIWINKYSYLFGKSVLIGIGGSLDIWSGKKKRAPEWMRKNQLEWFYRVVTEPQRLERILRSLPVFIFRVLRASLQTKQVF